MRDPRESPLRICLECDPPHAENCTECFGWGWQKSKAEGVEHIVNPPRVLICGRDAGLPSRPGDERCAECGGTRNGRVLS